ncbi:MAG: GNAT family N-acetyltransferase [Prevotellaceae bacterium]|jgi:GNAT superfamily N-acetyltransferase|nr:GNAT family N-acetyltransferase [Prevotellaceae bacterium]
MSGILIRKARREDCPQILALIKQLAVYEREPDAVIVSPAHFEESGFGENPVWWAFVAEEKGIILGFALYYIRYSTWKGQRIYLEDICVDQKMRGKGIGKILFESLLEEAEQGEYSGLVWQVLDWNEPAINFYKKYNTSFDDAWLNCSIDF